MACYLEHAAPGAQVLYRQRVHDVASVKLGLIAGPHARLRCIDCPPGCDAETLTSFRLLTPAP